MAITLKCQLNETEKQIILARHGRTCFATGHPIPSTDKVHFDHGNARGHIFICHLTSSGWFSSVVCP
jgi:hypothetical protein